MQQLLDSNLTIAVPDGDAGTIYAATLLRGLGASVPNVSTIRKFPAASRWKECSLDTLTGYQEQVLEDCPVPVAECADGALAALDLLGCVNLPSNYRGADLLTLRSTMTSNERHGDISASGSCRLVSCLDGTIAVNLPRDSDWELLHAWLMCDVDLNWDALQSRTRELPKFQLISRGRLLGLAVADAEPTLADQGYWYRIVHRGLACSPRSEKPRIVDLSSLWAGPLCSQLLSWKGAQVIKVESSQRPDGARIGSPGFYRFLNEGKQEMALDLHTPEGVAQLLELIRSADIVIEASRPRALRHMGIFAEQLLEEKPGLTWISITGYGREEPEANWIAYGDDAAVAAGLSAEIHKVTGQWMFCGDAIADPLTGMHAAVAGYASWLAGGGHLLLLSLAQTVQHCVLSSR